MLLNFGSAATTDIPYVKAVTAAYSLITDAEIAENNYRVAGDHFTTGWGMVNDAENGIFTREFRRSVDLDTEQLAGQNIYIALDTLALLVEGEWVINFGE